MASPTPSPDPPRSFLRRSEQLAAAAITAVCLVFIVVHFIVQAQRDGGTIDIDHAEPLTATFRVDLNSAAWPEIAELPGIGKNVAERIVAERVAHGPYKNLNDVQRRVKGIGAKVLDRIKPLLRTLDETPEPSEAANPAPRD